MADLASFRADFPEFAASPDPRVNFWLVIASKMLNVDRWGDLIDHGQELFVAHHLALDSENAAAAALGGAVGQNTGPLSSQSVDKVSEAFDTGASSIADAGHWNLTTYGTQFYALWRMMGVGGIQL